MSNVESLFGGPTGEREVSETAVRVLTDLLEMAKSGEILGVAAAYVHADGSAAFHIGGNVGGFSLVGAVNVALAELVEINRE